MLLIRSIKRRSELRREIADAWMWKWLADRDKSICTSLAKSKLHVMRKYSRS
jgi:hypothetical protein